MVGGVDMPTLRDGLYLVDGKFLKCSVKRIGGKNTRIVLGDGREILVPSEDVTLIGQFSEVNAGERVIPSIPLEALYRRMRKLKGTPEAKYQSVKSFVNPAHGPKASDYLTELFIRSVRHSESYSNILEAFYPVRVSRHDRKKLFARDLVSLLGNGAVLEFNDHRSTMVDYEVYPFRTTLSCCEDGRPATRLGSGGMDLLLASNQRGMVPAVGEIKAKSEQVGPTFALVQALMYAAQLTTRNQFARLQRHYQDELKGIDPEKPRMDVVIILEDGDDSESDDLRNAVELGGAVREKLSDYLRHVHFLKCKLFDNRIQCKEVKFPTSDLP